MMNEADDKGSDEGSPIRIGEAPSRNNSFMNGVSDDVPLYGCHSNIGASSSDLTEVDKESKNSPSLNQENQSLSSKSDQSNDNKNSDSARKGKKKSWFNTFSPNYKTMSDEFKKIASTIPSDERLIVAYSCALQKEILIQGWLYLTKNYLCFYSKILGLETQVELSLKDVTSITKEKTALVIPNAIQIGTAKDKYYFTSFTARDHTFDLFENIWQLSKSNQELSQAEVWNLVHSEYRENLGLSSEDESEYVSTLMDEGETNSVAGDEPTDRGSHSSNKHRKSEDSLQFSQVGKDPSSQCESISKNKQTFHKNFGPRHDGIVNGAPDDVSLDGSNTSIGVSSSDFDKTEVNPSENEPKGSIPLPSSALSHDNRSFSSKSDLMSDSKNGDSARKAKKKSWFNAFSPNYKSMSVDFKKITSTIPPHERLIVGYLCALQREILIQGRLYLTKNYLCFYSKILGWETQLELALKDVVSITKGKTALVIPNAILISTAKEKYFFGSFATRDRTFDLLEKVWQLSKSNQEVSQGDVWNLVQSEYGENLGLTPEDENDYESGWIEDGDINSVAGDELTPYRKSLSCNKISLEESTSSNVRQCASTPSIAQQNVRVSNENIFSAQNERRGSGSKQDLRKNSKDDDETLCNTDSSEEEHSSEGRRNKKQSLPPPPSVCPEDNLENWRGSRDFREFVDETLPMPVDNLFTLLFTNSEFFLDFHSSRKTFDMESSSWYERPNSQDKERILTFTISFAHPMGPKNSQVTETQIMSSDSRPGYYYMIDTDTVNAGIPYADSFYITVNFCLSRVSDKKSRLTIRGAIKYKKTLWGMLKTFIEKSAWTGLEEFYGSLVSALKSESELVKRPRIRGGRSSLQSSKSGRGVPSTTVGSTCRGESPSDNGDRKRTSYAESNPLGNNASVSSSKGFVKLILALLSALFVTNFLLFYKMYTLESRISLIPKESLSSRYLSIYALEEDLLKLSTLSSPTSKEEWLELLKKQELIHQMEMEKWFEMLGNAMTILRQTENSLSDLEKAIHPWTLKKSRSSLFSKLAVNTKLEDTEETSKQNTKKSEL